jgi:hypothetical protein
MEFIDILNDLEIDVKAIRSDLADASDEPQ